MQKIDKGRNHCMMVSAAAILCLSIVLSKYTTGKAGDGPLPVSAAGDTNKSDLPPGVDLPGDHWWEDRVAFSTPQYQSDESRVWFTLSAPAQQPETVNVPGMDGVWTRDAGADVVIFDRGSYSEETKVNAHAVVRGDVIKVESLPLDPADLADVQALLAGPGTAGKVDSRWGYFAVYVWVTHASWTPDIGKLYTAPMVGKMWVLRNPKARQMYTSGLVHQKDAAKPDKLVLFDAYYALPASKSMDDHRWKFIPVATFLPHVPTRIDTLEDLTTADTLGASADSLLRGNAPSGWHHTYAELVALSPATAHVDWYLLPLQSSGSLNYTTMGIVTDHLLPDLSNSWIKYDFNVALETLRQYARMRTAPELPIVDPLVPQAFRLSWVAIFSSGPPHVATRYIHPEQWSREIEVVTLALPSDSFEEGYWRKASGKAPAPLYSGGVLTYAVRARNPAEYYAFGLGIQDLTICRAKRADYLRIKNAGGPCPSAFRVLKDHEPTDECTSKQCIPPGFESKGGGADLDRHNVRFPSMRDPRTDSPHPNDRPFIRAGDAVSVTTDSVEAVLGKLTSGHEYFVEVSVELTDFGPDPAWLEGFDPKSSPYNRRLMAAGDGTTTTTIIVTQSPVVVSTVPAGCRDAVFDADGNFVECEPSASSVWWIVGVSVTAGVVVLLVLACMWSGYCDHPDQYEAGSSAEGDTQTYHFRGRRDKHDH